MILIRNGFFSGALITLKYWCCGLLIALGISGSNAWAVSTGDGSTDKSSGVFTPLINTHSKKCIGLHEPSNNIHQYQCKSDKNQQKWEEVPASGGFMLRNRSSKRCMDVSGASQADGANIMQYRCHGGSNQIFTWQGKSLRIHHSGKCVDVGGASTANRANIQQWHCNGTKAQSFDKGGSSGSPTPPSGDGSTDNGSGVFTALSNIFSKKCIDLHRSAGNIDQNKCNNSDNQQWEEVPVSGGFMLRSRLNKQCMTIAAASQANGANIVPYRCHGKSNQIFYWDGVHESRARPLKIKHSGKCVNIGGPYSRDNIEQWQCNGSNYQYFVKKALSGNPAIPPPLVESVYRFSSLTNVNSGKCIALHRSSGNIQQNKCNGKNYQEWEQLSVPDSRGFMLRNRLSNQCMTIAAASKRDGANIVQRSCSNKPNQIFDWQAQSLRVRHSGKCVDVIRSSTANGANIRQWHCNGTSAQFFYKSQWPSS